ncbi:succinylglutamate desuccinylase [Colwellia psychrerythraea]|uniref:Succinylglutamate desuccinylase n=1 Tax=Colwellia psychrerythraea TaxID=28229 RepID=A0A099KZD0_COLPS|nr:succinylglutamate desuccinylase [Colwellia psychrerythraea]KGJ94998.1 Succinylglutamate desuccinylase [Colwellia psychrerythraea]
MQNDNTLTSQELTDINGDEFNQAYQQFLKAGDFISLTRQFELGFEQAGRDNQLSFSVNKAKVSLLDTGILLVEPENSTKPSKSIVISSAIHGNETAPIEIVQQLISDIVAQKIQVKHRTLFIMGNPVAMNIAKRFQTENLNRLFCGKHKDISPCFEKDRAEKLETYVSDFFNTGTDVSDSEVTNYHYDLHTAIRNSKHEKFAIYPYQGDKPWDKEQLSFMAGCGVNTILFGHGATGTFSYYSSANFSAHAFTVELGKVRAFGENNMANFAAMTEKLTALICDEDLLLKDFDNKDFNLYTALGDITKISDNFKLFIGDDVSNFTDYPVDTLLSTDTEQEYRTTLAGESIVFPNAKVGNGQRAVLMVVPTTLS